MVYWWMGGGGGTMGVEQGVPSTQGGGPVYGGASGEPAKGYESESISGMGLAGL